MGKKLSGQVAGGRSRAYERLTPESAVLLLVDHQSGLMSGVRDLAPDGGAPQCGRVRARRARPPCASGAHLDCTHDVGPHFA